MNAYPELFGLHENADITCAQNETFATLSTLLSLQPRVAGGAHRHSPHHAILNSTQAR